MGLETNYKFNIALFICLSICLVFFTTDTYAQKHHKIADLSGNWKFSVGDNSSWSNPDFNDSNWDEIRVPGSWESRGFHGYDGYAWYRKKVELPNNPKNTRYYLSLGYIDDVDEVYVNGKKIGFSGQFPPYYTTAYNARRIYSIPRHLVKDNKTLSIAIRVFDEGHEGGIIHGDIALYVDYDAVNIALDLSGNWKFRTGKIDNIPDREEYKNWDDIIVPGFWENQGYKNYDSYACYVKEFSLNGQTTDKKMVLLLGRIDDLDMVYLNGKLIGQSGEFKSETVITRSDTYKQLRNYYIPENILIDSGVNVLIIKVYDHYGSGGIYDGDIGLISQEDYIKYWRKKSRANR